MNDCIMDVGFLEDENDLPLEINENYRGQLSKLDSIAAGVNLNPMFLEKPHSYSRKSKANIPRKSHMINKIISQPDFEFLYDNQLFIQKKKKSHMNIADLLLTLKQYFDLLSNIGKGNNDIPHVIYHTLYVLLCETYIIKFDTEMFKYEFLDNELLLCVEKIYTNLSAENIAKLSISEKVRKFTKTSDGIKFIFNVNVDLFLKEYIKSYGTKKNICLLSTIC